VSKNRWIGNRGVKLGDDCRIVTADGTQLIDGFIFKLNVSIGSPVVISGMDKTADMMDCPISGTGEFKGLTVKQIISKICEPFGVTVSGKADSVIDVCRYGLNEMAIDIIRDLCGRSGILANSDGAGNVVLTRATDFDRSELILEEGNNILSGSLALIETRRSTIKTIGQNRAGNSSATAAGTSARHRPQTVINGGNLTAGQALTGVEWLASMATPESYIISVAGFKNVRPNTLIDIESRTLGVSGSLLIRAVVWDDGKDGSTTSFDLVNPAMYGGENVLNELVN
jgi:prophage tail gpP-like protein